MMAAENTNWTCAETESRLSDFLDGLLAPDELAAFARHRADCAACDALCARVGATVNGLHGMAFVEEPPELVRTILDRTIGARALPQDVSPVPAAQPIAERPGWFDWIYEIAQPRFAYGALTVLVSALVVSHALGFEWRRPTTADLEPANLYREANRQSHMIYARGSKLVFDSRIVFEIQSAFEAEPAAEPAPRPKSAPGQTEILPRDGSHRPTRAGEPANFMRHAVNEVAILLPATYARSLP